MTTFSRSSLCLTLAIVCLPTSRAFAQTICFPAAEGIPGTTSKVPDWWTVGAVPFGSATQTFLEDPRWQGASGVSHVSDNAQFRALVETGASSKRFLLLSWTVRADPNGPGDRLYLGFWDDTASAGNVFRLERAQATATGANGERYSGGAFNGRVFHRIGSSPWVLNNMAGLIPPPLPAWLKADTRIDVSCPSGTCSEWSVRMRIPIDPAASVDADDPSGVKIAAGSSFRFWYEIQDGGALGTTVHAWPEGLSAASETAATIPPYAFPDPATWSRLTDGAPCAGDVSFDGTQISINTPGSMVFETDSANVFRAKPTNRTSAAQPGNSLKARFRIANFGPTFGTAPEWTATCSNAVGVAGAISVGGPFELKCSWVTTAAESCSYKPTGDPCGAGAGTRNPRQCVLVDLASAPGGGPTFFSHMSAFTCEPPSTVDAGTDAGPPGLIPDGGGDAPAPSDGATKADAGDRSPADASQDGAMASVDASTADTSLDVGQVAIGDAAATADASIRDARTPSTAPSPDGATPGDAAASNAASNGAAESGCSCRLGSAVGDGLGVHAFLLLACGWLTARSRSRSRERQSRIAHTTVP